MTKKCGKGAKKSTFIVLWWCWIGETCQGRDATPREGYKEA